MRVLERNDVERLLDMESCIRAVEDAFRARGEGRRASSRVLGLESDGGTLHAKLGSLTTSRSYAAAKINANFPDNPARHDLPTIQGVLLLFDASRGTPLASMDSALITAKRTAAATAVAAKYLAVRHASTATFIGCGIQARAHLEALRHVRGIARLIAFDLSRPSAERFTAEARARFDVVAEVATDIRQAASASEIVITSTPSRRALLNPGDVAVGTLVAAVGADSELKQEISADLLRQAVVVVDDLDQCSRMGDLHHALALGVMQPEHVRASLDQIVTGLAPGRLSDDEIIVFDSTGVAIEDVAAAALVYERAEKSGAGFVIA
jgi:ornithine cyclodeaminase/alanine dehydrogenase-like protein (mu-crystallin family)